MNATVKKLLALALAVAALGGGHLVWGDSADAAGPSEGDYLVWGN